MDMVGEQNQDFKTLSTLNWNDKV